MYVIDIGVVLSLSDEILSIGIIDRQVHSYTWNVGPFISDSSRHEVFGRQCLCLEQCRGQLLLELRTNDKLAEGRCEPRGVVQIANSRHQPSPLFDAGVIGIARWLSPRAYNFHVMSPFAVPLGDSQFAAGLVSVLPFQCRECTGRVWVIDLFGEEARQLLLLSQFRTYLRESLAVPPRRQDANLHIKLMVYRYVQSMQQGLP